MNWVRDRAAAQKLPQQVTNCVVPHVIATLSKKPQVSHLKEFYNEAVGRMWATEPPAIASGC